MPNLKAIGIGTAGTIGLVVALTFIIVYIVYLVIGTRILLNAKSSQEEAIKAATAANVVEELATERLPPMTFIKINVGLFAFIISWAVLLITSCAVKGVVIFEAPIGRAFMVLVLLAWLVLATLILWPTFAGFKALFDRQPIDILEDEPVYNWLIAILFMNLIIVPLAIGVTIKTKAKYLFNFACS